MIQSEFFSAVKSLNLQPSEYIVIGSGVLAALGIRDVDDIDLIVSETVFKTFERTGEWRSKKFEDGSYYLLKDIYEIGLDWDSTDSKPNLEDLKQDELLIAQIPFVSLDRLKRWKLKKSRVKDLEDIRLIESYQTQHQ